MFLLDSHCDTPSEILRLRDLSKDNENGHVDFPKLKKGGVDGAFFALYVPADKSEECAYAHAYMQLEAVRATLAANPHVAASATSPAEAYANKSSGLFSVFMGLENGTPIGHSIERLHEFYDAGVRYVTLCHSRDNQICDSCASANGRWSGLSPFGKDLVGHMNDIGMLVDVSHISDNAFYDVIELSAKPVVATHSCCRALAGHPRNMTDDMIRKLAENGGVIQINFYPVFLDDTCARASFRRIADHIDHAVEIAGVDHVGIGSDFDGIEITPEGMDDISYMPVLLAELSARGYSESDMAKIAGENFFRVMNVCALR